MRSTSEGVMRSLPVITAAALVIGLSGCSSWKSGSSTRSSDSGSPTQSGLQSGGTGSSRMSESQVRQDLKDHGYSNLSGLHQSGNDWMGSATDSSGAPVNFDIDPGGVIVIIP